MANAQRVYKIVKKSSSDAINALKIEVDQLKVDNTQLKAEQSRLSKEVVKFLTIKDASFNKGFNEAYDDAKCQMAYIHKSIFKKG